MPKPVRQRWDKYFKTLSKKEMQAFVHLVKPGATFIEIVDKELLVTPGDKKEPDLLIKVSYKGRTIILHIEFQKLADETMDRRVWEYNAAADIQYDCPVDSIIIYLTDVKEVAQSPYRREIAEGEFSQEVPFRIIKLCDIDKDTFKREDLEGLLPLMPLAKDGKNRENVEDMIATMRARGREDLLTLGFQFASLVLTSKKDQLWLKEKREMLNQILSDTWVFQDIVEIGRHEGHSEGLKEGFQLGHESGLEEGIQRGIQRGIQQGIQQGVHLAQDFVIRLIKARFSELEELAKTRVDTINDPEQLQQLFDDLNNASDQAHAEQILLTLPALKVTPQAALQAAQQTVLAVVKNRFPELEELAKTCVATVSTPERLQQLIADLAVALNPERAEQLLRALSDHPVQGEGK